MRDSFEETGGDLPEVPNEKYQKFFDKFKEIDTLDISKFKAAHLLGYFCKKYKETYKANYSWKFNNESPSKCFEVWQFNTLCAKLSANPKILKDYIDWIFSTVVPKTKVKFRSISFITKDETVNDYKINVLLASQGGTKISRSTILPTIYQETLKNIGKITIQTYGELSFISQIDPRPNNIGLAFDQLVLIGFDTEILKRIV